MAAKRAGGDTGETKPGMDMGDADDRTLISGRVRTSVRKRMKLYAAEHDVNLQDLMDEAIDHFLKSKDA